MMFNAEVKVSKLCTDQADAAVTRLQSELIAAQTAANTSSATVSEVNLRLAIAACSPGEKMAAEATCPSARRRSTFGR
jgi:hypothetical protein